MKKFIKRDPKKFSCGQGLKELRSFRVKDKTIDQIIRAMGHTALSSRSLSKAVDILEDAIKDDDCKIVLTLSGIVTISKMGSIICEMIEDGWIDCIVATGALIAHGAVEGKGGAHFAYDPSLPDDKLYEMGYDRIYDTIELESNLDTLDNELSSVWQQLVDRYDRFGSADFCHETGKILKEKFPLHDSILKSAYQKKVPVIIPAFTDSELALDAFCHFTKKNIENGLSIKESFKKISQLNFNPFLDLSRYLDFTLESKKMAILTLGGGVPRNYGQQVMPLIDILMDRLKNFNRGQELTLKKFLYGVRICPEPVNLGGLSGCTYDEGISWGKFASAKEGGRFAEVFTDYTAVLPWLTKALQERMKL